MKKKIYFQIFPVIENSMLLILGQTNHVHISTLLFPNFSYNFAGINYTLRNHKNNGHI